jgi:G3E family GTPase
MFRVPFILVTGFLGSGKTTFLKRFLDQYSGSQKIAVVQNEFAPGSIDGPDLKSTGKNFELLEVNKGSVFCVCLLGSFVKSLAGFVKEHKPDVVILEASGLSDPISIGEMLQGPDLSELLYLSRIWSIIDASNFAKLAKNLPRIQHQVRVADRVVINKTDLESSKLEEIKKWVRYLNPFASIVPASYCEINMDFDDDEEEEEANPVALKRKDPVFFLPGSGRPDLAAFVIKSTRPISRDKLEAFLDEVSQKAIRVKGFALLDSGRMLAIQSCFGKTTLEYLEDYSGPTEIMGVGPDLDRGNFGDRFEYYQNII